MLSLFFALSIAHTASAGVPKSIECTYKEYSCTIVNGHCFGPPPPLVQLPAVPLTVTNPSGGGNNFEGELRHSFTVNGKELAFDVKGSMTFNNDGSVPQGISVEFTDPATGLSVRTGGEISASLDWSVRGARDSLTVWCSLKP